VRSATQRLAVWPCAIRRRRPERETEREAQASAPSALAGAARSDWEGRLLALRVLIGRAIAGAARSGWQGRLERPTKPSRARQEAVFPSSNTAPLRSRL
jgi:hypothetical protein